MWYMHLLNEIWLIYKVPPSVHSGGRTSRRNDGAGTSLAPAAASSDVGPTRAERLVVFKPRSCHSWGDSSGIPRAGYMVNVVHIDCEVDPRKIHTKTSRLVFIMSQVFLSARHTSCHNDLEEDGLILPQVFAGDLGRASAKYIHWNRLCILEGDLCLILRGTYPKGGEQS